MLKNSRLVTGSIFGSNKESQIVMVFSSEYDIFQDIEMI